MTTKNSLIGDAEFLLAQGGPLTDGALDAVTAQPWVDTNERLLQAKRALLAASPSPELELILAEEGTKLNEHQLEAVTAEPWVDKDALIAGIHTRALEALRETAA